MVASVASVIQSIQLNLDNKSRRPLVNHALVGKSDFDSGILVLGSIFPNFPEYFS